MRNDIYTPNSITEAVIGCSIEIHQQLGPGLLESTYETCLAYELEQQKFNVEQQKALPIKYKDVELECGYRIDLLINDTIIVELKAVEKILPVHKAQLLSYLRLTGKELGLLINFNVPTLKSGISRIVNNFKGE